MPRNASNWHTVASRREHESARGRLAATCVLAVLTVGNDRDPAWLSWAEVTVRRVVGVPSVQHWIMRSFQSVERRRISDPYDAELVWNRAADVAAFAELYDCNGLLPP